MTILPWGVEFDEGEALGYCLLKVAFSQDNYAGLGEKRSMFHLIKKNITNG